MTSKCSTLKNKYNAPFLLSPAGKDYIWGGTRLKTEFGKNLNMSPLAETWECSTHPDGVSVAASGKYKGKTLTEIISLHPEILGERHKDKKELPVLVKFIDAKSDLSVQVHPSDEYAKIHENGQLGKSEMWYVVDADEGAKIVYGFNRNVDKKTVKDDVERGKIEGCLRYVPVKKNEVYFIEAGTVHAIGAGALIAEVQENSNLTYRLYDYNRMDKNGAPRQLHLEKALDVLNYSGSLSAKQPMRVFRYSRSCAKERLCGCKYFEANRMLIDTEVLREPLIYSTGELSFRALTCLSGCGAMMFNEGGKSQTIEFYKGDTIFIPANSVEIRLLGKANFLEIEC